MMITHVGGEDVQKTGLSFRKLSAEARIWEERGITTLEQADQYIERRRRESTLLAEVAEGIGIRDRELSPTERQYLTAWIEDGHTKDAILIAYDKTITRCGTLKWPYMRAILSRWKAAGIHTAEDIARDSRRGGRPSGFPERADEERYYEDLKRAYHEEEDAT